MKSSDVTKDTSGHLVGEKAEVLPQAVKNFPVPVWRSQTEPTSSTKPGTAQVKSHDFVTSFNLRAITELDSAALVMAKLQTNDAITISSEGLDAKPPRH